jgi:hypothetical protein
MKTAERELTLNGVQGILNEGRGPHIIENRGIPTRLGLLDIEVDPEALRAYFIDHAKPDSDLSKLDELIVSFGAHGPKTSYGIQYAVRNYDQANIDGDLITKSMLYGKFTKWLTRLLNFSDNAGMLRPTEKYPMLYFNTPALAKRRHFDREFRELWTHETEHLYDYLTPGGLDELLPDQHRMHASGMIAGLAVFLGCETKAIANIVDMVSYGVPEVDFIVKGGTLAIYSAMSVASGFAGGVIASTIYHDHIHKGERRAYKAAAADQSEPENLDFLKLSFRI